MEIAARGDLGGMAERLLHQMDGRTPVEAISGYIQQGRRLFTLDPSLEELRLQEPQQIVRKLPT